jgi:arginine/lysine/histidine transporter system substrate-binding protein
MNKKFLYITITLIMLISAIVWYRASKITMEYNPIDTITIGTNTDFPPFSFIDNDAITGFDIDVITEVCKRLEKKIIIKDMQFDALLPQIQMGNIHVVAGGITPTEERAERSLFTKPHLTGNPLVIISTKTKTPIHHLYDLKGKTVAVNEGYLADSIVSELSGVDVLRLPSAFVSDGMLALETSRADAFVTATHSVAPYFEKYDRNNFYISTIEGAQETSAFAISKYYPELRNYIQMTLDRMQADGTLDLIKKKWNLV